MTYVSSRFAYSIRYPPDWVVTPATQDWNDHHIPNPFGPAVDRFGVSPDSEVRVLVSSDPLGPGQTAAERIAQLDFINAGEGSFPNACLVSDRHTITLDGSEARQESQVCFQTDHLIEVVVVRDGRFHLIDIIAPGVLSEADRAMFDRFISSFRFGG